MTHTNIKIAVLDDYQNVAAQCADWHSLLPLAKTTFYHDHIDETSALIERLRPYDIICVMRERTRIDAAILDQLPNLKLIVTTAMRNAALDIASAQKRGIIVCGTGAVQTGTPELVWLHLLAHARNFEIERAGLRDGRWQLSVGRDLHGATLGLVGLGRVGERVARVANAFGMKVIAWSPHLTPERAESACALWVPKEELFSRSDYVVIAMQLRENTRGLVGATEIARMKSTAYLINTSRAALIDEEALLHTLSESRIGGAGLDVFETEPLPRDHPYWTLPNVLITPHLGYVTRQTYDQFYRESLEDIHAWMQGKPIRELDPTHS